MFGLGVPELILILVIVVLVFGAGKLANVGGALGKSVKEFRDAADVNNSNSTTTVKTVTNPDGSVTTVKDETKTQA
jgi:sec-independent protein translocase protein TatA